MQQWTNSFVQFQAWFLGPSSWFMGPDTLGSLIYLDNEWNNPCNF